MKIITISGAQGCGKTTVAKHLKKNGYNVLEHSHSRVIMNMFNTSIDQFRNDEAKIIAFQDAILHYRITMDGILRDDCTFYNQDDIVFVERSLADLAAFATIWHTGTDNYSNWLEDYKNDCSYWTSELYDQTIILPSGKFRHVDDGVRADSDTQEDVSNMIIEMSTEWFYEEPIIIEYVNIDERINEIILKTREHND